MLTEEQFEAWAREVGLSARAIEVVQQVRHGDPVRRPGPSPKSASVDFASRKMGRVISTESRTVELPAVLAKEYDDETLEMWEQPLILRLRYGKVATQTPVDFLVLERTAGAVLEQWKDERWLIENAPKKQGRWVQENGIWRSPPEEAAAADLGLSHRVRTSAEFEPLTIRNLTFLAPHLARYPVAPDDAGRIALSEELRAHPGSDLGQVLSDPVFGGPDVIWPLVGHGVFWVDIANVFLARPNGVELYLDKVQAEAWRARPGGARRPSALEAGTAIEWDGVPGA